MDNVTLKKKLSAYLSDKGYLKNVSNAVLYEVLLAWENWPGTSRDFYQSPRQTPPSAEHAVFAQGRDESGVIFSPSAV